MADLQLFQKIACMSTGIKFCATVLLNKHRLLTFSAWCRLGHYRGPTCRSVCLLPLLRDVCGPSASRSVRRRILATRCEGRRLSRSTCDEDGDHVTTLLRHSVTYMQSLNNRVRPILASDTRYRSVSTDTVGIDSVSVSKKNASTPTPILRAHHVCVTKTFVLCFDCVPKCCSLSVKTF